MPSRPPRGAAIDTHDYKTIKHFEEARAVHELTFSCFHRQLLLTNDTWRRMLGESISAATARHGYSLLAFVFMPEHVHLLVLPQHDEPGVSDLLKAIKRPFSHRIKELLKASNSRLLEKLTVRQREGVMTFRYWQEGPGYDRNLESPHAISTAIDYIHLNPVRRRLCSQAIEWKWSSARHYLLGNAPVDPDLPRIDRCPFDLLG